MHIEIPQGLKPEDKEINSSTHYTCLLTNWYRLKDTGLNLFDCIKIGLID